ncbi:MAG: PIN domain-containing protein [Caldilineaceae bacterium]
MKSPQIVIDTSAFISALLSQRGAAYKLLMLADQGIFEINVSVSLIAEYEDVAKRLLEKSPLNESDIDDILDYVCMIANRRRIFFLACPFLREPR